MKHLAFRNQGQLSVLDLITMGNSTKRDDGSTIEGKDIKDACKELVKLKTK